VGSGAGTRAARDDIRVVSAAVTPIVIRAATREDVGAIVAIEALSFNNPWSAESFEAFLARETARVLAAVRDGVMVGYAIISWVLDEAELSNIAVTPAERGRGVGAALLDRALADLTALGVGTVYLEVRGANAVAQSLYASRGFAPVGRRARYYDNPVDDAILMRRAPTGTPAA
jgi:ribosomal-protein-alanine N-acetyltransferase